MAATEDLLDSIFSTFCIVKHPKQTFFMHYYEISLMDCPKASYALHEITKVSPNRPKPAEMPPVFYKFFPSTDVEVRIKPQYQHLCCKKCGRFDPNKAFEIGFDDPVTIRFKGDYGYTNDRTFVINNKFLDILEQAKVGGFETKPLGKSGWHALRVTLFVNHVDGVVKTRKPLCPECGRPKENFGLFQYRHELSLPEQPNTFFTPKTYWPSYHSYDRQIFISEDVLQALREGQIAGGYCTRLWTDEELEQQKQKKKEGTPFWWPPKTSIHLNGKPLKKKK